MSFLPQEEPLLCLQLFHWILEYLRAVSGGDQHLHLPRDDVPLLKSLLREAEHFQLPGAWTLTGPEPVIAAQPQAQSMGGWWGAELGCPACILGSIPPQAGSGWATCDASPPGQTSGAWLQPCLWWLHKPAAPCWAHGLALGPQICAANHTTPLADKGGQAMQIFPLFGPTEVEGAFQPQLATCPPKSSAHCPTPCSKRNMLGTHPGTAHLLASGLKR